MEWLIGTATTIYLVSLVLGMATGRVQVRDQRGRPKPIPAALLAVGLLVLVGALAATINQ